MLKKGRISSSTLSTIGIVGVCIEGRGCLLSLGQGLDILKFAIKSMSRFRLGNYLIEVGRLFFYFLNESTLTIGPF